MLSAHPNDGALPSRYQKSPTKQNQYGSRPAAGHQTTGLEKHCLGGAALIVKHWWEHVVGEGGCAVLEAIWLPPTCGLLPPRV